MSTLLAMLCVFVATSACNVCIKRILDVIPSKNCYYGFQSGHAPQGPVHGACSIWKDPWFETDTTSDVDMVILNFKDLSFLRSSIPDTGFITGNGVIVAIFHGQKAEVLEVFKYLWGLVYVNVIVVVESQLYTYYPISQNQCNRSVFPIALGDCTKFKRFFKESETSYLKNCTFVVFSELEPPFVDVGPVEDNVGLEIQLVHLLAQKLEFQAKLICETCGCPKIVDPNDNSNEPLYITVGGHYITWYYYDSVYYQRTEDVAIFVLPAQPRQPWKNIPNIFEVPVWIAMAMSIVAFAALATPKLHSFNLSLTYTISVLFLNDCKAPVLKLPFILWSLASLILTSGFSGLLLSFMCKQVLNKQLSTPADLKSANYTFGVLISFILYDDYVIPTNLTYGDCDFDGVECYADIFNGSFAYLSRGHNIMYQMSFNRSHNFYKLPSIKESYLAFWLDRNAPFTRNFQKHLQRFDEAGITGKLDVYSWKPRPNKVDVKFRKLELQHVYLAIICHLAFTAFAILAFVIELLSRTTLNI